MFTSQENKNFPFFQPIGYTEPVLKLIWMISKNIFSKAGGFIF